MSEGEKGKVRPITTKNSFGSKVFVWLETWHDGFGGNGVDYFYVPAWAIEVLETDISEVWTDGNRYK